MKPVILFRKDLQNAKEMKVASKYFEVYESRVLCGGSKVVGRYSVLPFYSELENDLKLNDCSLVNDLDQHRYIADFEWYFDLADLTPRTWFDATINESAYNGPFIVKGKTNSRKFQWDTLMYAKDRGEAMNISSQLSNDPYIGEQGIIYRKYVPLRIFEIGVNGLPFSNEWRFFFYKNYMLTYGFYWSCIDDLTVGEMNHDGIDFAYKCAELIKDKCTFFVLDIAEKAEGGWILIEINDGQMSGLSECQAEILYGTLKECFIKDV